MSASDCIFITVAGRMRGTVVVVALDLSRTDRIVTVQTPRDAQVSTIAGVYASAPVNGPVGASERDVPAAGVGGATLTNAGRHLVWAVASRPDARAGT